MKGGSNSELEHFHTLTHFTVGIFLRHNMDKEAVVVSIESKQTGSLHVGADWRRAVTDHRNETLLCSNF